MTNAKSVKQLADAYDRATQKAIDAKKALAGPGRATKEQHAKYREALAEWQRIGQLWENARRGRT